MTLLKILLNNLRYDIIFAMIISLGFGWGGINISLSIIIGFFAGILNAVHSYKWKYIKTRYYEFIPTKELIYLINLHNIQIPLDLTRKDVEDIYRILCYKDEN